MLSELAIRSAKPQEKPAKLFDGEGMFLLIQPTGGKLWRLKYRYAGREKLLALGAYPQVSLKAARERRHAAKALLAEGQDPGLERKLAKLRRAEAAANSFESVARAWLKHHEAKWTPQTRKRILDSMRADVFPKFGDAPISSLAARDVKALVKTVEGRGSLYSAGRLLQRVKAVFRYAVTHDLIASNPLLDLKPDEVLKARHVTHRAALPEAELPSFLAKLDAFPGDSATAAALRLLLLTAVRPGELRSAEWREFDLDTALWRIPAEHTKMRSEHLVPLSRQAIVTLAALLARSTGESHVFPSPYYPKKTISENTVNSALARMGFKGIATAHGFRSLFSTVANEHGHDADVIERQLGHVERNKVRAAYHRATYVKDRTVLMQWWADYIDGKHTAQASSNEN
ncbi:MAG: tyrosine-type recombinase/integrase [Proteobacteria bacterium]|nr:tyrosine-type recombinase/integrase [Pseudomonadota bacterium]